MVFTYVLILMMANSNAMTTAEFHGFEACLAAGREAVKMANGTVTEIRFICARK